jgi:hypothetical protein
MVKFFENSQSHAGDTQPNVAVAEVQGITNKIYKTFPANPIVHPTHSTIEQHIGNFSSIHDNIKLIAASWST